MIWGRRVGGLGGVSVLGRCVELLHRWGGGGGVRGVEGLGLGLAVSRGPCGTGGLWEVC